MISDTVSVPRPSTSLWRDPVLVLPIAVVLGLAVGWIGERAGISGSQIVVDLALGWLFAAASVVASLRVYQPARWVLLATAGLMVLAGDLGWSNAAGLWTVGTALEWVWLAVVVQFVLTFPDGRPSSRLARATIAGGYLAAAVGGLIAVLVSTDGRDAVSVLAGLSASDTVSQIRAGLAFAVALATLWLVGRRLALLRGAGRRAQAPVLASAMVAFPLIAVTFAQQAFGVQDTVTALDTVARALVGLIPIGFMTGVLWSRSRARQATELVVELRTAGALSLRDRLARTLGDPTLELAYRLGDGSYVDESGKQMAVSEQPGRAVTVLRAGDDVLAALVHDPALLDEPALVESVRATTELVLENDRLAAEVRAQLVQVRASRVRLVLATDEERQRIERDLHDGAQQRLVALCVTLGLAAGRARGATQQALLQAQDELEQAIAELRALARGIHPTILREEGLDAAIDGVARRAPLPVEVRGSVGTRLAPPVELAAYLFVCEALTNTSKHAHASAATVSLARTEGNLSLSVSDNGQGGAHATPGGGLAGLRDRVEALDGTLVTESHTDIGTTVGAEIPCES